MRTVAGTGSAVITSLGRGTEVTFTGNKTSTMIDGHYWAEVTYNGTTGWVAATYLAYEHPDTREAWAAVGTHGVYVGSVPTGGNHSNVIIFADPNSQLVKDNSSLFVNTTTIDGVTWSYATFGAAERNGGPLGSLVANPNRPSDVGVVNGTSPGANMIGVAASYESIKALIDSDTYFRANSNGIIKYGATMTATSDRYNSNSYARGLLNVAGISAPSLSGWFPGWDKPIPTWRFGR